MCPLAVSVVLSTPIRTLDRCACDRPERARENPPPALWTVVLDAVYADRVEGLGSRITVVIPAKAGTQ